MAFEGGPYLTAACLCDTIIEDKGGVLSLIRIIDILVHGEMGPNPPEELPPFNYPLKLVLMLKSGAARGRSNLQIKPELPTGESLAPIPLTAHFEGEEKAPISRPN